jgi:hypothetical protein
MNAWRERLMSMCLLVMKALLCGGGRMRHMPPAAWVREQLQAIVESHMQSLVYDKIMEGVSMICGVADFEVKQCLEEFQNIGATIRININIGHNHWHQT